MKKNTQSLQKVLSVLITISIIFTTLPITQTKVSGAQPTDEFTPYRESEHFRFEIPSSFMKGKITPKQLGWYLSEMDKFYEVMADFVGGADGWLPRKYPFSKVDTDKVLMIYDPIENVYIDFPGTMSAMPGCSEISYESPDFVEWTVDFIKDGKIFWPPVHELGHVFGSPSNFNAEWIADFLMMYASIVTETEVVGYGKIHHLKGSSIDAWYQLEYAYQAMPILELRDYNTRYGSILNCAIFNFVRDHGWGAISKTFGSYHDRSYPYLLKRYGGNYKATGINDFIDCIDYFGNVDFRTEYLDNADWLELINDLFPVYPIRYVNIGGKEYTAHTTNLQLSGKNLTNEDIEVLDQMTHLLSLNLNDNNISDISSLKGLGTLHYLDLRNNEIKDIPPFEGLTNLRTLDLRGNYINDVKPLYGMGTNAPDYSSVTLDLTYNQVTIEKLKELKATLPTRAKIIFGAYCDVCWKTTCVCQLTPATTPPTTTTPKVTTTAKPVTTTAPSSTTTPLTTTSIPTTQTNTTAPITTTSPATTTTPEQSFILGRIISNDTDSSVFDALEILKYLVGMDSKATGNPAALITVESQKRGVPSIFDALEILKYLVGMANLIDNPVS